MLFKPVPLDWTCFLHCHGDTRQIFGKNCNENTRKRCGEDPFIQLVFTHNLCVYYIRAELWLKKPVLCIFFNDILSCGGNHEDEFNLHRNYRHKKHTFVDTGSQNLTGSIKS